MIIIGVDFHPEFQQMAFLNTVTGEVEEKRLAHPGEVEKFYRALASANESVRIGEALACPPVIFQFREIQKLDQSGLQRSEHLLRIATIQDRVD